MPSRPDRGGREQPRAFFREALAQLCEYARWAAEGSRVAEDGAEQRAHWEVAARRGNADALARLSGPEFPEELADLWTMFATLSAMRGEGMSGPAPLTAEAIRAGDVLLGWQLHPHEVEALVQLDIVTRRAWRGESVDAEATPRPFTAWPVKKMQA